MQTRAVLDWDAIDTVLVDMDGTLLDLAFDNFFWLELVPERYAERHGIPLAAAREMLRERFGRAVGTLSWYCVDHWSRDLDLDIASLKRAHDHMIRFLPRAPEFLRAVRGRGKPVFIVTNAHQETIAVKAERTGVDKLVDGVYCSHELAAPKESIDFWTRLRERRQFDPERTLLLEDSLAVLAAARAYGLKHMLAIRRPDSGRAARDIAEFPSIEGVAELI
jgi:HAD superfamily hydrolase (TIGR01509 family)